MSTLKPCYHYVNRFQSGRNSKQNLTDIDREVEKWTSSRLTEIEQDVLFTAEGPFLITDKDTLFLFERAILHGQN